MKTKLDHMRACLHQWQWLEAHPENDKDDYVAAHPDTPMMANNCAACEWDLPLGEDALERTCEECFLMGYAWDVNTRLVHDNCEYTCEYGQYSLYRAWSNALKLADTEMVRKSAHEMVEAIKRAIEDELKKGEEN